MSSTFNLNNDCLFTIGLSTLHFIASSLYPPEPLSLLRQKQLFLLASNFHFRLSIRPENNKPNTLCFDVDKLSQILRW